MDWSKIARSMTGNELCVAILKLRVECRAFVKNSPRHAEFEAYRAEAYFRRYGVTLTG